MRTAVVTLLLILPVEAARGEEPSGRRGWKWSVAALAASTAADAHSSWNRPELNPILQNGAGRFGLKGIGIKAAIAGGAVATQWLVLRKNPGMGTKVAMVNFGMAGAFGAVAVRNHRLQARPASPALREPSAFQPSAMRQPVY